MQNDLYRVVQLHMRAVNLCIDAQELVLSRDENEKDISFSLAANQAVKDTFEGRTVEWTHVTIQNNSNDMNGGEEHVQQEFTLKMRKKDKQFVMTEYLAHVLASASEYRRQLRELSLYSNNDTYWESHNFKHPSTFDTLAMEPELKAKVKADLDSFLSGEKFFRKVGRAWKRGYLLYGPPGTGKSSMIAAMANYLKYDIYDLELTQVFDNNSLKQLLVNTTSKSIIVIEDIDCSLDLAGQRNVAKETRTKNQNSDDHIDSSTSKVTLSGLLNFTDGLWSCCGDERIIIFTTNHVEKLDAALLRPGRMDMHIHMSYCCFETFKALAFNYLSIDSHPLFGAVKRLLEGGKLITPAQVTEHLFGHREQPTAAMEALIAYLEKPEEPKEISMESKDVKMESKEEKEGIDKEGVANGVCSKVTEAEDLEQKLRILEEKVQTIVNNLNHGLDPKADVMSNGAILHMENGDLHTKLA